MKTKETIDYHVPKNWLKIMHFDYHLPKKFVKLKMQNTNVCKLLNSYFKLLLLIFKIYCIFLLYGKVKVYQF